ncbi:hypothetical protein [Streptomyces melanosporofaciens]|uniref:hypothetical protein n=1 Tax=Streptomyces melanosporofaciens TaxID=67327 RepID=UPI00143025F4|nr:hypothetical protein [Streptomyces melanosporofaciens]
MSRSSSCPVLIAAMRFGSAFSGVLPCSWATVRGKAPSAARDSGAFEDAEDDAASEEPHPVRAVAARAAESRGNRRWGRTDKSSS